MLRLSLAFAVFGLAIILASAAPVPRDADKPLLFYPTAIGTKRVYQWGNGVDKGSGFTTIVSDVKRKDGAWIVTVNIVKGEDHTDPFEVVVVTEKSISYGAVGTAGFQPPLCWLALPAKEGHTWNTHLLLAYPGQCDLLKGRITARSVEKVEVPAGTFECIRVEGLGTKNGMQIQDWRWYAIGLGVVKCVNGAGDILELESVALPK